jgi:hypothetical protein
VAGEQSELDQQPVPGDRPADALLGLAYPVLDGVLVQRQPLGRGLEAAALLQEDAQGVAQRRVVVVIGGERPEGLGHPGPQELDRAGHQGQRSNIGEAGDDLPGRARGQRDGVRSQRLLVGAAESGHAGTGRTEREPDSGLVRGEVPDGLDLSIGE